MCSHAQQLPVLEQKIKAAVTHFFVSREDFWNGLLLEREQRLAEEALHI